MPQEDRVTDALVESVKASQQQARRIDLLERRFESLEATLNTRMENLENEMATMNAHLDNLVREAQMTNQLLREESEARKVEVARKMKLEDEERAYQRSIKQDQRAIYKKVGSELWNMFRQPLGFLVAAFVAWLAYQYLAIPHELTTSEHVPAAVQAPVK